MKLSDRKEDYLKVIDQIVSIKGYAQVKDISKELHVSPSTVSLMLKKLMVNDYINYEKYSCITLTQKGKNVANNTQKKYKIIRDFLITLGIDNSIASIDACKMEHIIASETYIILTQFCEFSMTKKGSKHINMFKKYCYNGKTNEKCDCKIDKKFVN